MIAPDEAAVLALQGALEDLLQASGALLRAVEETGLPAPRPRFFRLLQDGQGEIVWPAVTTPDPGEFAHRLREEAGRRRPFFYRRGAGDGSPWPYLAAADPTGLATVLWEEACRRRPDRAVAVVHGLRRAAAWCLARADGLRRARQQLLVRQRRAVAFLETEAAAFRLKAP